MPSSSSTNGGGDHSIMDFSSLLSRGYRPAHLSRIVPKERPKDFLKKEHHDSSEKGKLHGDESKETSEDTKDFVNAIGTTAGVSEDRFLAKLEKEEKANRLVFQLVSKTPVYRKHLTRDDDDDPKEVAAARLQWSTKMMGDDAELKSYAQRFKTVSII